MEYVKALQSFIILFFEVTEFDRCFVSIFTLHSQSDTQHTSSGPVIINKKYYIYEVWQISRLMCFWQQC